MTQRILVIGGPWPERIGCAGQIAEPTPEETLYYPFAGRSSNEVIVLLDNDPLKPDKPFRRWTCALLRKDVKFLEAKPQ